MQRIVKEGQTFRRRVVTDDEARDELADEPYKLELIGAQGRRATATAARGRRRRGRRRRADHLRQPAPRRLGGLEGPVPRPAPAHDPADSATASQLTRSGRRVLARQRDEPAAAARLRHRLAEQGRAAGPPRAARRGRAARPPPARRRARPVLLPRRDRFRPGGVPPQGRRHPQGDGGLLPAPARARPGYAFVYTPHITKAALFETSGHLHWYADGMFPPMHLDARSGDADGDVRQPGQDYYLKPMNCPFHNLIFRARGPVLPRAAAAAVRVRLGVPVREVRRRARPDPGARDDPGRRAHLLHPRADARRAAPTLLRLRARPAARLRPRRLLPRAVHPRTTGQVRRLRRGVGRRPPSPGGGRRGLRARAGARPGRRRVLRAEDLGAGAGRDRAHLADVDHPARLQPAGAVRPGVPRRPTAPGSGR